MNFDASKGFTHLVTPLRQKGGWQFFIQQSQADTKPQTEDQRITLAVLCLSFNSRPVDTEDSRWKM
jgi:hypothetical protein